MKSVRVRSLLAEGKTVLNGWSVMPGAFLAEIMGSLGWDALKRHGLTADIHTASPAFASRMAEMGFRFITLARDLNFIHAGGTVVTQARTAIGRA